MNKLDETMFDFHKFLIIKRIRKEVNLKVVLDNAIFPLKDKINDLKVNINVKGDNLLSLNMVLDEIKHIFFKID